MKQLALVLVLVLATACGGGGPATQGNTTQLTPQETVQQILEDCVAGDLSQLTDLLDLLADLQNPNTPPPAFELGQISVLTASVGWSLDTDNDNVADLFGTIQLRDASGVPAPALLIFFNPNDLAGSLAALPDGTQIRTTFDRPGDPNLAGDITIKLMNGLPDTASGTVTVTNAAAQCTSIFSFTDVPAQPLLGAYPTGQLDMDITTPTNSILGDVTTNGTSSAVMSLALNGGAPMVFNVDLDTQTVTPAP